MDGEEEIDLYTFLEQQSRDNETYSPVVKAVMIILTYLASTRVAQTEKNPPAMQETWVQSLDWEDTLEKGTAAAAAAAKSLQSCLSDSVRPHRQQPTRLPRPWDSPDKNTEWVAISFSNARKRKVKAKSLSRV